MTKEEEKESICSYIETALWSSPCESEGIDFLDQEYSIEDFDESTLSNMKKEMVEFINKHYYLVDSSDDDTSYSMFAHNLWLTRNGHGTGFWDGDYKYGEELTAECEKLNCINLYVGDDGKIYSWWDVVV